MCWVMEWSSGAGDGCGGGAFTDSASRGRFGAGGIALAALLASWASPRGHLEGVDRILEDLLKGQESPSQF